MSPSAKGSHKVPESSNINPNIKTIATETVQGSAVNEQENTSAEQDAAPEHTGIRGFLDKKIGKASVAVAAIAVAAGAFGAVKAGESTTPTHEANPGTGTGQGTIISPEERDFINAYKDRYADDEATYQSEVAYLKANPGKDLTIGNDYFAGYNFNATPNAPVSPLGFETLILKPGTEVTTQTSVDQFNLALPEMNRLMNLLAKNPLPEQTKVVKDEFEEYTGFNNSTSQLLTETLGAVVTKYGSNAVYVINEGTTDTGADKTKKSIFDGATPIIDNVDTNGLTDSFHTHVKLSITVTSYDKAGKSVVATESLDNFQFSVSREQNFDPANVGLVGIGAR